MVWLLLPFIFSYVPHGHCYLWQPGLVSLHFSSDILIALAYYSIPITLVYFVKQRRDLAYRYLNKNQAQTKPKLAL